MTAWFSSDSVGNGAGAAENCASKITRSREKKAFSMNAGVLAVSSSAVFGGV